MRMATEAEKGYFLVEKKSFYSLSSRGEPFEHEDGAHVKKGSDLATLIPSTDLAPPSSSCTTRT